MCVRECMYVCERVGRGREGVGPYGRQCHINPLSEEFLSVLQKHTHRIHSSSSRNTHPDPLPTEACTHAPEYKHSDMYPFSHKQYIIHSTLDDGGGGSGVPFTDCPGHLITFNT